MTNFRDDEADSGLILAAEECPPEKFADYHSFSSYDDVIIRKLSAHGPVLVRGGRGSGKSALLIEANRRMKVSGTTFPVYVSLRYLPLLRSDGDEYIRHFCDLLCKAIKKEIKDQNVAAEFGIAAEQASMRINLISLAQHLNRRIVLLFDDAAHIGREKPLEVFFDLFRTMSSDLVSCKASIYPGVTKFGVRFDVFNDSTVVDISRSEASSGAQFFPDVIKARYPSLAERSRFSDRMQPSQFANMLGRAVVGNLRGLILACNHFDEQDRIGIPEITRAMLAMATDYYWPLMDEVAPKLGVYEPLIETSREVVEGVVDHIVRPVKDRTRSLAQDRVLIHRQTVSSLQKIFEILEYLGFIARREASRSLKSGGRGPVYAVNLCSLLDAIPSKRLTIEMIEEWVEEKQEPSEIHVSGMTLQGIRLPSLPVEHGLAIFEKPIETLTKSRAYPYGMTMNLIDRLKGSGIATVGELADSTDEALDAIDYVGGATIKRIRDVVYQAVWM
jgi:hypothetical protein